MKKINLDTTNLIGKTVEEAIILAKAAGFIVRLTEKDGINYMVTFDLRFDRVNLRVEKEKIIRADIG